MQSYGVSGKTDEYFYLDLPTADIKEVSGQLLTSNDKVSITLSCLLSTKQKHRSSSIHSELEHLYVFSMVSVVADIAELFPYCILLYLLEERLDLFQTLS
jgi:hypothetical protein